jgi:hypothetical protein
MLADCARWPPHFHDQSESVSLIIVFFSAVKEMMMAVSARADVAAPASRLTIPIFLSGAIP